MGAAQSNRRRFRAAATAVVAASSCRTATRPPLHCPNAAMDVVDPTKLFLPYCWSYTTHNRIQRTMQTTLPRSAAAAHQRSHATASTKMMRTAHTYAHRACRPSSGAVAVHAAFARQISPLAQRCIAARRTTFVRRAAAVRVVAAAVKAAEPGSTTLGFVGIGIMGVAMVRCFSGAGVGGGRGSCSSPAAGRSCGPRCAVGERAPAASSRTPAPLAHLPPPNTPPSRPTT